jgi:hypothetical protein
VTGAEERVERLPVRQRFYTAKTLIRHAAAVWVSAA